MWRPELIAAVLVVAGWTLAPASAGTMARNHQHITDVEREAEKEERPLFGPPEPADWIHHEDHMENHDYEEAEDIGEYLHEHSPYMLFTSYRDDIGKHWHRAHIRVKGATFDEDHVMDEDHFIEQIYVVDSQRTIVYYKHLKPGEKAEGWFEWDGMKHKNYTYTPYAVCNKHGHYRGVQYWAGLEARVAWHEAQHHRSAESHDGWVKAHDHTAHLWNTGVSPSEWPPHEHQPYIDTMRRHMLRVAVAGPGTWKNDKPTHHPMDQLHRIDYLYLRDQYGRVVGHKHLGHVDNKQGYWVVQMGDWARITHVTPYADCTKHGLYRGLEYQLTGQNAWLSLKASAPAYTPPPKIKKKDYGQWGEHYDL